MDPAADLRTLEARLRAHVETLARAPRVPGTEEHARSRAYALGQLQRAGFAVSEEPFHQDVTSANLLTEPQPADPGLPLLVIGAHYDSVPGTPGADDNASGVAALLELARLARPVLEGAGPFHSRLQLAVYDLEEYGMVGSDVHARALERAGVGLRGMVSLEMLGFTAPQQRLPPHLVGLYPAVGNFIGVSGNERSRELVEAVAGAMKTVPGLPVEWITLPGNGEALPEVRLSDHSSFWERGQPALMLTDTSFFRNPHYHQPTDTPETLDYPFLARVTLGVAAAVGRLLRP